MIKDCSNELHYFDEFKNKNNLEQVILVPENFTSKKELIEFLSLGGIVLIDNFSFDFKDEINITNTLNAIAKYDLDKIKPFFNILEDEWFLARVSDYSNYEKYKISVVRKFGSKFIELDATKWKYATQLTDSEFSKYCRIHIEDKWRDKD